MNGNAFAGNEQPSRFIPGSGLSIGRPPPMSFQPDWFSQLQQLMMPPMDQTMRGSPLGDMPFYQPPSGVRSPGHPWYDPETDEQVATGAETKFQWPFLSYSRPGNMLMLQRLAQDLMSSNLGAYYGAQPALRQIGGAAGENLMGALGDLPAAGQNLSDLSGQAQALSGAYTPPNMFSQFQGRGGQMGNIGLPDQTGTPQISQQQGAFLPGIAGALGGNESAFTMTPEGQLNLAGGAMQGVADSPYASQMGVMAGLPQGQGLASTMTPDQMMGVFGPRTPESYRPLNQQMAAQAQNLLDQPYGLTPEIQEQIMRGVRDEAFQARQSGTEAAMANLGARGLGTRGALGSQAIMGAHQREGEQVAGAQRQLQTQAALARPGELAGALGASLAPLAQAQQSRLGNLQTMGSYGLGYGGLGLQAETQGFQNQLGALQAAAGTQQAGAGLMGQYGLGLGGLAGAAEQRGLQGANLGLQQQIAQAQQQQAWNQLLQQMGMGQEQMGLAGLQQQGQGLELAGRLGGQYAGLLQNQIPMYQNLFDYGIGMPYTQLSQGSQLANALMTAAMQRETAHENRQAGQSITGSTLLNAFGNDLGGIGGALSGGLSGVGTMLGALGGVPYLGPIFGGLGALLGG